MEITILSQPEGVWYAPDVFDNREKPEDQRVKMFILPATGREIQRLEEQGLRLNRRGGIDLGKRMNQARAALVSRCVQEIANLPVRDASTGVVKHVENGEQLVALAGNAVADDLIRDAVEAIKDHSVLLEGVSKK